MADILASVSVVLGAEISGFRAAMADARKELRGLIQFSEGLKDIGSSLTTYVSAPLAVLGVAAVAASAKMESLGKGLQAISTADLGKQGITGLTGIQIAAQRTGDRLLELQELAKAPGIGFAQAVQGDIRLRSVGISAEQSAKSLKEFANAIATTGGGAGEFDRVTTQLAQLSAKGKVLSQDLRPIIEAAPAVSQALLKLYGTIDSESISASLDKQGKSSKDFIAILTDELGKLPRVTGGLANAFENLQQTGVQSLAKLGDGISRALNLPALVEGLTNGIERIGNAFAGLSPGVQRLVVGFGLLVTATGPILVAVGTLGAALPAITAGFATLGVTSLAALAPILPVALAVGAAALLIYENCSSITEYFSSGEGSQLFSGLATAAQSAVSAISGAFSTISANISGNFGEMVSAAAIFRAAFRDLAIGVTSVLNVLAGTISGITSLLTGDLTGAADGAKQAFYGLIDPIANLLGFTVKQTTATQGLIEKFDALAVVTPGLASLLNGLGQTQPFPVAGLAALTQNIGLLKSLKDQLKAVQEQRDKETTVGAIKVDNAAIISLQKQIAALEGTDKSSKKAAEAIAKLRLELSRLTALDNVLGNAPSEMEVMERRSTALLTGLKTLIDAGVSPSSKAFRGFAQEAVSLGQQLDQLKGKGGNLDLKPVDVKSLIPSTIGDTLPQDVARLLGDYAKQAKPFELPVAVKLNMQAILDAPNFSKDIQAELQNIGAGFREADTSAEVFGRGFDASAAKVQVLGTALQNLIAKGISPANLEMKALGKELQDKTDLLNINKAATDALGSGLASLGTGLLEGLGQLAAGNLTLASFGETVLGLVGKLATQLGEAIVAVGIGMLGLKTAFTNPFGAIAAGAALIVVGAALSSIASSAANSGGGGSANVSTAGVPSRASTYNPPPAKAAPDAVTVTHNINLVAKGSALVGVLNVQTTRNGRVTGGH
jgi:tape measure domain-containing protein